MIVGDDIGVAILRLVEVEFGILPGELLTRINGLKGRERENHRAETWGKVFVAALILPRILERIYSCRLPSSVRDVQRIRRCEWADDC